MTADSPDESLLRVENLEKHFPVTEGLLNREVGRVQAVDGIDLTVGRGETVGLIGESGCGKSTAALSMLRLQEPTDGRVFLDGEELTAMDSDELRTMRRRVQLVFQDPNESFDPRHTIGESVAEPLMIHGLDDAQRRREVVVDLLERVGLNTEVVDRYPHALSGGQKQRAALARALVLDPDLLVLDEPVSALDVSVQAEILQLLSELKRQFDLSVLLISHNMDVVRELCDRIAVMYLGEIVERGPREQLLANPQHPYTRSLVASIPRADPTAPDRDVTLTGEVPDASDPPPGCRFHTRCPEVIPPDEYDFAEGVYPHLIDLRVWLRTTDPDRAELDELAAATGQVDDPVEADDSDRAAAVRAEFDLPDPLGDDDAETALADALGALAEGRHEAAHETLDAFESVCERESPALAETPAGHPAACLRVDVADEQAAERPADD